MATNLRLIAYKVGDLLKYDTTLKEINRVADSFFRFRCETFPADGQISSERAQLIYNWILSLGKQRLAADERDRLLAQFCQGIAPEQHKEAVAKILLEGNAPPTVVNRERYDAFLRRGLHPEVVRHSQKLFLQGNFFHAVFEVSKAYNKRVREKAQSAKDGYALMLDVWGCEKGVLKVTPCQTETDRNVQDGIKFLSAGLMQAVRNPTAHEPAVEWPISQNDSLDILSFISFLFRKLDDATYFKA